MGYKTGIEWTDSTWSPIRAQVKPDAGAIAREKGYKSLVQIATKMQGHVGQHCEAVSAGCKLCYSGTLQQRCLPHNGTGLPFDRRSRDLVDIIVDNAVLVQPFSWSPRKIFPCNQTDLFADFMPDHIIDRVFAVMAACRKHTFQVLTKRPARMLEYVNGWLEWRRDKSLAARAAVAAGASGLSLESAATAFHWLNRMPLDNVWLGVSVEDQPTADERVGILLDTPAALHFISYEPALAGVDWRRVRHSGLGVEIDALEALGWGIMGAESGAGARPADLAWFRQTRDMFGLAGRPLFMKQLGRRPIENGGRLKFKHSKGGDEAEWPKDLQGLRQFPTSRT